MATEALTPKPASPLRGRGTLLAIFCICALLTGLPGPGALPAPSLNAAAAPATTLTLYAAQDA